MPSIFVSYSSSDRAQAITVKNALTALGYEAVFLDVDATGGIAGGIPWFDELSRQIRMSVAVVALYSERFFASKWCFAEIVTARQLQKTVISLAIDTVEVPAPFHDLQVIDFAADAGEEFRRLRRALQVAGLSTADSFAVNPSRPPFPGLFHFTHQDAGAFFGRDRELAALRQRVESVGQLRRGGVVVVAGASGAGKSSLVRAGLIPCLRKDSERWFVPDPFRPSDDFGALRTLAQRLEMASAADGELTGESVMDMRRRWSSNRSLPDAVLVISVDQFEELLVKDAAAESKRFVEIVAVASGSGSGVVFVLTLRSDFLGELQSHPFLRDTEFDLFPLGLMPRSRFGEVIEKPAAAYGVMFEPGLAMQIANDAAKDEALPLLAFTLRELWDTPRTGNVISKRAYEELGGLQDAIGRLAERTIEDGKFAEGEMAALEEAFLLLARVGEQGQLVRERVPWMRVGPAAHRGLEMFVGRRLLVSSPERNERMLEVAHEALFRVWPRLKQWIEKDRVFLQWRGRLLSRIGEWESGGGEASLIDGAFLAEALAYVKERPERFSAAERKLIDESVRLNEQRAIGQWRERLQERIRAWQESGERSSLLLGGDALSSAEEKMTGTSADWSEGEREYLRRSRQHQEKRKRRSRQWRLAARFAGLALLMALGVVVAREAWLLSDAFIVQGIRNATENALTGENKAVGDWAWLAKNLGLNRELDAALSVVGVSEQVYAKYRLAEKSGNRTGTDRLRAELLGEVKNECRNEATCLEDKARWYRGRGASEVGDGVEAQVAGAIRTNSPGPFPLALLNLPVRKPGALEQLSEVVSNEDLPVAQRQAAWREAVDIVARGARFPDSSNFNKILEHIPPGVSIPEPRILYANDVGRVESFTHSYRNRLLFHGLVRAGRKEEALQFARTLVGKKEEVGSIAGDHDEDLVKCGPAFLRDLSDLLGASAGVPLAQLLADAGDPASGLELLRKIGSGDDVRILPRMAVGFAAQGQHERAFEVVAQIQASAAHSDESELIGRICEKMIARGQSSIAVSRIPQIKNASDKFRLMAMAAVQLIRSGRLAEGQQVAEQAEGLAGNCWDSYDCSKEATLDLAGVGYPRACFEWIRRKSQTSYWTTGKDDLKAMEIVVQSASRWSKWLGTHL